VRLNAALAGRYTVEREIGAGGMATVYLAEDVKHRRKVAIKVLREDLGASVGGARFLREIEIAAQLQHPNILPLLDSGEADGLLYYVMPFVEGQSLRQRLAHERELPIAEAVRIVTEIVDALAYAHGRGVVHRDIKPDNVMLSGRHALITDFGVARAVREAASGGGAITTLGVALGTPAYMAPEQATADPNVDHRADIYAAGIVAYELLAGRTPFQGTTPQQVLAAHVTETPDPVAKYRPGVSPQLEGVVMKCLAKRPADRWQTSGEFLAAIEPLATPSGGMQPTSARLSAVAPGTGRIGARGAVAAVAMGVVAIGAWLALRQGSAPDYAMGKTSQLTTESGLEIHPAISPDGKLVAYVAGTAQQMRVFIRPVGGGRTIQLTDDSIAVETQPRWSPDGTQILFLVRGGASVASALGGPAKAVVPPSATAAVNSATWSPDGKEIAFGRADSLFSVAVAGGAPRLIGTAGREQPIEDCDWSRDGRFIACVDGNLEYSTPGNTFGNIAPSTIRVYRATGGPPVVVSEDSSKLNQSPRWAPDSRELFFISNRDGARDVFVRRVGRDGTGVGPSVRLTTGANAHSMSLTADGQHLAYSVFTSQANVWALPIPDAPTTAASAVQVTSGSQTVESMIVSRDGKWVVYDSDIGGPSAIFRVPVAGGTPELLASEKFDLFAGDLSPDGREVAYHSWRNGTRDIEVKALDGSAPVRVTDTPDQESYPVWSPDGSALAFYGQSRPVSLFVVRRSGGKWGTPVRVASGGVVRWMPDGKLVFVADTINPYASGRTEAIRTAPIAIADADGRNLRIIYAPSGSQPHPGRLAPSADGKTIFFKTADPREGGQIWSVPAAGGVPRLLVRFTDPTRPSARFDFSVDTKRFFFRVENRQSDVWIADLNHR
jgi:Tol biopolymer transport system component/tRNA A-37 threonylcarbamoyl transferase component Bud32